MVEFGGFGIGGGGAPVEPAGNPGEVQFNDGTNFGADSAFIWDNANKGLGLGATAQPTNRLLVRAKSNNGNNYGFLFESNLGVPLLRIRDTGELELLRQTRFQSNTTPTSNIGFIFTDDVAANNRKLVYGGVAGVKHVFRSNSTVDFVTIHPASATVAFGHDVIGNAFIDIRSQSALFSAIQFRVRSNDNLVDYISVRGNGVVIQHIYAEQTTGNNIEFIYPRIYNTFSSPATGNITNTLTDAKTGIVQKIYHQDAVPPTFPAEWNLIGFGDYVTNVMNIIYAEFSEAGRVEYWIDQP